MKYVISLILFSSSLALAQQFENLGSVSTSLGGAGVGAINTVDGAFNNPAAFPMYEQRAADFGKSDDTFRVSLSDNGAEALFPAMLGYSQTKNDDLKSKTFYLGLGYLASAKFSLGANFGFQETELSTSTEKYRQNVVDVGAMYRPNTWFSLGVVLKNQPLNDTEMSDTLDNRPNLAFGFETRYEDLVNMRAEYETGKNANSDQRAIVKAGMEIIMNQWIQLRLGYQNNNILSQNYLTAGIGFGGPQFGLHYAYIKESEFKKETHHSIDLTVPF